MRWEELPTPCYVIDERLIRKNLEVLQSVMCQTGCKILLAQKAFSMYALYPLIGQYLSGTAASSLYEARLGAEEMGKENHCYCPAYRAEEIDSIIDLCDHIVFNSAAQLQSFGVNVRKAGKSAGLRINPERSTQEHALYDPCSPYSRLGATAQNIKDGLPMPVDGLHFHTLCEQDADALVQTLEAVEKGFGSLLEQVQWINFGGGHHITKPGYDIRTLIQCIEYYEKQYHLQVYLEPGEAVAYQAGFLITTVLDIVNNGMNIAILDTSAACHMPDVLEMPYRPAVWQAGNIGGKEHLYRFGGMTCLAGDVIGDYSFDTPIKKGQRLVFEDMAIYSMVKNNTFNGMKLPAIALRDEQGACHVIRQFGYDDFKNRLS